MVVSQLAMGCFFVLFFFFFKQKTAYEIVSRDWSSDVCSSDLAIGDAQRSGACFVFHGAAFGHHRHAIIDNANILKQGRDFPHHPLRHTDNTQGEAKPDRDCANQIGRASCRERV